MRLRVPALRGFFAALARDAAGLRAVEARVAPVPADFARVDAVLRAALGLRVELALRAGLDLRAVPEPVLARVAVEREALDFRFVAFRPVPLERAPVARAVPLEPSSPVHFPDMTRCAASATASAMIEPSLVALDIMLVAACDAESAASRPASRILRRAAGLALIAAAAAARPAASISLLIAALANLSTVSLLLEDLEELLFAALAIVYSPSVA